MRGHTRTTAVVDLERLAMTTIRGPSRHGARKAIALIGKLPGTLDGSRDRGGRCDAEQPASTSSGFGRIGLRTECFDLRRKAAAVGSWITWPACVSADPSVPAALHDRAADCWRSLLAIADAAR